MASQVPSPGADHSLKTGPTSVMWNAEMVPAGSCDGAEGAVAADAAGVGAADAAGVGAADAAGDALDEACGTFQ
jgi:hypothetical protein